jgi:hypothetical protein
MYPQHSNKRKERKKQIAKQQQSRANTTMGLVFEHMIKARAHKGGVRIGKTPKKLASICHP